MTPAHDLEQLQAGLFIWRAYDPVVKADLFSSAIAAPGGTYIVDPISLEDSQLARLREIGPVAGIIVTNANHHRAGADCSDKFSLPIFAQRETFPNGKPPRLVEITDGARVCGEIEVIEISGAVAGEVVLYNPMNGGTLVIGDSLINCNPYGFAFLPRRYCLDEKEIRRSLRRLLRFRAEQILSSTVRRFFPVRIGAWSNCLVLQVAYELAR